MKTDVAKREPIAITQNYGLVIEDTQYTLYRRHTVDPTKAPGWERKNAESIAQTGAPLPSDKRETWVTCDKHYPLTPDGIIAITLAASVRDVNGVTAAVSIAQLITEYRAELARTNALITEALR
jgi:hypothetical protein